MNALCIRLSAGTLSSLGDLFVLGGANALAHPERRWRLGGSCNSPTPNSPRRTIWTLTRLLRGQAGTEGAMRAPVAAGARVVILDGALKQLVLRQSEATLPFNYLSGPPNRPIADPAYVAADEQFQAGRPAPAVAGASARGVSGERRSAAHLDPPHPYRRR